MDNLNIGRHISGQFNEDLERIINHVMHMGGLVEKQLTDALTSVCDADEALAKQVLSNDYLINNAEVSIDDECTRIIAKRQPAAGDLRLVMAIVKTITDLERIGDEAGKIANVTLESLSGKHKDLLSNLDNLGRHVLTFLQATLDAFTRMDFDAAVKIHKSDDKIDREYEALMRQLMTYMMEFLMDGLFARLLTKFNQELLSGKMLLRFQRTINSETHPTLEKLSKDAKNQKWDLR